MKNYTSGVPVEKIILLIERLGNGMLGKKHSEETKRKISFAHKGKILSAETRIKMSLAKKGKKRGPDHPNWKGGEWIEKDGRVYVYRPNHPHANNKGYVFRARLVMERILMRYLDPNEVVHHKNGNPNDDRPENLKLFSSKSAHISFHNTGKIRKGKRNTALKDNNFKLLPGKIHDDEQEKRN